MRQIIVTTILGLSVLFTACSTTSNVPKSEAFKGFYEEKPATVLLTTPINKSESADEEAEEFFYTSINVLFANKDYSVIPIDNSAKEKAEEYFYSSLNIPFVDKGYSVITPESTEEILKSENALDPESLLKAPLDNFREKHGVDMVVFTLIHEWEQHWREATMNLTVEYIIKSTLTNEVLYSRKAHIKYDTYLNQGFKGLALASVEYNLYKESDLRAFNPSEEKYLEVARACNLRVLRDLPYGKYHGNFGRDYDERAGKKEFKVYLNEYSEL